MPPSSGSYSLLLLLFFFKFMYLNCCGAEWSILHGHKSLASHGQQQPKKQQGSRSECAKNKM